MLQLLREFPAGSYEIICQSSQGALCDPRWESRARRTEVTFPWGRRGEIALNPALAFSVAAEGMRAVRRGGVTAIWANHPGSATTIGAWMVARRTGLPLTLYMHDMWEENEPSSLRRAVAHAYEPRVFRDAHRVLAITAEAADYFERKHSRRPDVLVHPVDPDLIPIDRPELPPLNGPIRLLFTGSVYNIMNEDTILAMAQAANRRPDRLQLQLITGSTPEYLQDAGIWGPGVEYMGTRPRTETIELQRSADYLYLPVAFNSPSKVEALTVFPVKGCDYLVSGRPTVIHAPAESHMARIGAEDRWAAVLTSAEPSAVDRFIDDLAVIDRTALVDGALAFAGKRRADDLSRRLYAELTAPR